jgi:hypothetical protein
LIKCILARFRQAVFVLCSTNYRSWKKPERRLSLELPTVRNRMSDLRQYITYEYIVKHVVLNFVYTSKVLYMQFLGNLRIEAEKYLAHKLLNLSNTMVSSHL